MDNLDQAASLTAWLLTTKKQRRNIAVTIACNKYSVPFSMRPVVSKRATELIKHPTNQGKLL